MASTMAKAQDGKATSERKTFSLTTQVSTRIEAAPEIVWKLLTTAPDFTRWNSTVTSLEGTIGVGEKIKLKSYLDAKRTFKITVKVMEPHTKMIWGDGGGTRTFTLKQEGNEVVFHMHEKMGGLMFPLYAGQLPPFEESFERFAADLKKEAELIQRTNH